MSVMLAAVLFGCGGFSGWRLGAAMRDRGLELRSQAADIIWLRAALNDSEKRCAQQAEWMSAMEAELVAHSAQAPEGAAQETIAPPHRIAKIAETVLA